MVVLSRHPVTAAALQLARKWCEGQVIDGAPALRHAVQVARKLTEHLPDAPPELLAAVLLHDSPYFTPDPDGLDTVLTEHVGPRATEIVRNLEHEHEAMAEGPTPAITEENMLTVYASAADKIVSLTSILDRAAAADDPDAYWRTRRAFVTRIPYFRAFHQKAISHLPVSMAGELGALVARAERTAAALSEVEPRTAAGTEGVRAS